MTGRGSTASLSFDLQDHILVGRMEGIDAIITFHADGGKAFERHFHGVVDDAFAKAGHPLKPVRRDLPQDLSGDLA